MVVADKSNNVGRKCIYVCVDNLLYNDEYSWERHIPKVIQKYINTHKLNNKFVVIEFNDVQQMQYRFENELISNNDIFLFTNPLSFNVMHIKQLIDCSAFRCKMIGMWSDGVWNTNNLKYLKCKNIKPYQLHELSIVSSLDKNLFPNNISRNMFRTMYGDMMNAVDMNSKLSVVKYPLNILIDILKPLHRKWYKQNRIVMPWSIQTTDMRNIYYDLERSFMTKIISLYDYDTDIQNTQILVELSKAKVAFLPYTSPNIGVEIYECLILETIPLVPYSMKQIYPFIPDIFTYPDVWTKNIKKYIQTAPNLIYKLYDVIDNYDTKYFNEIHDTLKRMNTDVFSISEFCKYILFLAKHD